MTALSLASIASADTWTTIKGVRQLRGEHGELLRSWTPDEWATEESRIEALGYAEGFSDPEELDEYSEWARDNPDLVSEAWTVDDAARGEGGSLPSADTYLIDDAAVDEGTLSASLGATALGTVALGPAAFALGVTIGNGLDSIFGLPKWELFNSEAEEKESKADEEARVTEEHSTRNMEYENQEAHRTEYVHLPKGYYYSNYAYGGGGPVGLTLVTKRCKEGEEPGCPEELVTGETYELFPDCPSKEACKRPEFAGWEYIKVQSQNTFSSTEHKIGYTFWLYHSFPECEVSIWEVKMPEPPCVEPEGVPAPERLTPDQEKENTEHEEIEKPAEDFPGTRPTKPNHLPEEEQKEVIEHEPNYVPEHWPGAEPGSRELEIPDPGKELATEYITELETLGFTDVTHYVVAETAINPDVGPEEVAGVDPAVGSEVVPDTHVTVAENPADAPIPPEHGGIGPFTPPGIHFPKLALLCNTMPFGVPCWLVRQIEAFSGTGSAPVWKIGPFHWGEVSIPAAEIHLASLEPVMEVVRPFMVIFGTIGIVLLFYRIFTGHAIGRGENPSGEVPDPESEE